MAFLVQLHLLGIFSLDFYVFLPVFIIVLSLYRVICGVYGISARFTYKNIVLPFSIVFRLSGDFWPDFSAIFIAPVVFRGILHCFCVTRVIF